MTTEAALENLLFTTPADGGGGVDAEELCTTAECFRALICGARCTAHIPALPLLLSNNHTVGVGVGWGGLMHSFKGWRGRGPQCRGNGGCAEQSGMSSQYSVCPPVVQIMETSLLIWSSDGSFTDLHCFLKTGNGLRNVRWPNRIVVIILNPHICRVGLVETVWRVKSDVTLFLSCRR